jgi:hypothetical protein
MSAFRQMISFPRASCPSYFLSEQNASSGRNLGRFLAQIINPIVGTFLKPLSPKPRASHSLGILLVVAAILKLEGPNATGGSSWSLLTNSAIPAWEGFLGLAEWHEVKP